MFSCLETGHIVILGVRIDRRVSNGSRRLIGI